MDYSIYGFSGIVNKYECNKRYPINWCFFEDFFFGHISAIKLYAQYRVVERNIEVTRLDCVFG